jgi:hypothetical protein
MSILERIILAFPATHREFANIFIPLLKPFGHFNGDLFTLKNSDSHFHPEISLDFMSKPPGVVAQFILSDHETITIQVENVTGLCKPGPHTYQLIEISEVIHRLSASGIELIEMDHVGFNLPWFSKGLHPAIIHLRQKLSSNCLYHCYPTGEPWDFILPGDEQEIVNPGEVDYSLIRRPKFELVSFDKASTPLIQFDTSLNADFKNYSQIFPEALIDSGFKNAWVYLENPYQVDICLVINEHTETDWSSYFKGYRV